MSAVDFTAKYWLSNTLKDATAAYDKAKAEREHRLANNTPAVDDSRIPSELPPHQYKVMACRQELDRRIKSLEREIEKLNNECAQCEKLDADLQREIDFQFWRRED